MNDNLTLMHDIVDRVRKYVPGSLLWISHQIGVERDDVYGLVIGAGFASCSIEEARRADDVFIRKLAAEILGFEVDSRQDFERRKVEAETQLSNLRSQLEQIQRQMSHWSGHLEEAKHGLGQFGEKPDECLPNEPMLIDKIGYQHLPDIDCPYCETATIYTDDGVDEEGDPCGEIYCVTCNRRFEQAFDVQVINSVTVTESEAVSAQDDQDYPCEYCDGTGWNEDSDMPCDGCDGTGRW